MSGWNPDITVDAVLRGQGAEPVAIRTRSPHLVEEAERALVEARPLFDPQICKARFTVDKLHHDKLILAGGGVLRGQLIARQLAQAQEVIVIVCTIGAALDDLVSITMQKGQMVHALALDGAGSAAVEALANQACQRIELEAGAQGCQTSAPLSPGMVGWTVAEGQPQIFRLVNADSIGVTLTEHGIMTPRKSLSMVLGIGTELHGTGRPCDFCASRETCRYQNY